MTKLIHVVICIPEVLNGSVASVAVFTSKKQNCLPERAHSLGSL